jgi:TonB family protein
MQLLLVVTFALTLGTVNYGWAVSEAISSSPAVITRVQAAKTTQTQAEEVRQYTRPRSSNRKYRAGCGVFALWADPHRWVLGSHRVNDQFAEFQLNHHNGDAHTLLIAENVSVPTASLKDRAFAKVKASDPNAKLVADETRTVNGRQMVSLMMEGDLNGTQMTYYGYYYSGEEGTVQAVTITSRNKFKDYQRDFTDLLSGLVVEPPLGATDGNQILANSDEEPTVTGLPAGVPPRPSNGLDPAAGSSQGGRAPSQQQAATSPGSAPAAAVEKPPIPLNHPHPRFTEEALKDKVEGSVYLRVRVGTDGHVKEVRIFRDLPDGLDEEAVGAVKDMLFEPAVRNNETVDYFVPLEVYFDMSSSECSKY